MEQVDSYIDQYIEKILKWCFLYGKKIKLKRQFFPHFK